jgi:hypothetical protein
MTVVSIGHLRAGFLLGQLRDFLIAPIFEIRQHRRLENLNFCALAYSGGGKVPP